MASLLQKLFKNQSTKFIVTTISKPQSPNLIPPLLTHLHHEAHLVNGVSSSFGPPTTEDSISPRTLSIFPSSPFGFYLNPIPVTGLVTAYADDVFFSGSPTIWADSVKKKRKRKMNKHKYKKLRKRLNHH